MSSVADQQRALEDLKRIVQIKSLQLEAVTKQQTLINDKHEDLVEELASIHAKITRLEKDVLKNH